MHQVFSHRFKKPVICVGRIAGQYAKPRSQDTETRKGISLPSYRGDMINEAAFNQQARTPNPHRLLKAHACAEFTLNHIRQYLSCMPQIQFYTAHEALHLHYEQALTRQESNGQWYNRSTHFPWIGMRTAYPDNAHVEMLRGINNPIGIKIGPQFNPTQCKAMLQKLNPDNEAGRISLITRLGTDNILKLLPAIISSIQNMNTPVTWICDPMHGNTEITQEGIKTRYFDKILSDITQTVEIHHRMGSILGGVHFELTGEHVTECIGGTSNVQRNNLKDAYFSLMDPRLNHEQSLEMAKEISAML